VKTFSYLSPLLSRECLEERKISAGEKSKNQKARSLFTLGKVHGQGQYQNWAMLNCHITQALVLIAWALILVMSLPTMLYLTCNFRGADASLWYFQFLVSPSTDLEIMSFFTIQLLRCNF
jgi:hypothetical protein